MREDRSEPERRSAEADSQQRLAASIVRQVQQDLPASDSSQEVAGSVRAALGNEGRANELTLGYVRVAGLASLSALSIAGYLDPGLVGATAFPLIAPVGALLVTVLALGFLLLLRGQRYPAALIRWVPLADGLILGLAIGIIFLEPGLRTAAARPGLAALGGAGALFLVFSGIVRLSASAQKLATVLAVVDWALLAWALGIQPVAATAVAVILIVLGIYGARLTLTLRRVIAFEVERERLARMYESAQSAIAAREEVLRMVAHDLRNPLSTIGMTADALIEMPLSEDQRKHYATTIARCGRTMNRLIQDLLDFARMEAGRISVEPVPTGVEPLLDRAAEMMAPLAADKDVELVVRRDDHLPAVDVDPDRVTRVFSNLIGNALKFTPPGGHVTVGARRVGDAVRFAISDTGPGIPPERVSQIFDSFWQADRGDRRGIGLGLAIARHIVDAHGGRIGVESDVGGGSEFWFTVPTSVPAGGSPAVDPASGARSTGTGAPATGGSGGSPAP